jgi:uncharacterized membrane protein
VVLTRVARGEGPPVVPPARWRVAVASTLAVLGLGVSVYLTVVHFIGGSGPAFCSGSGTFSCETVTTSPQSHVFGIPVAVLGLAYYLVMAAINSPWAWRSSDRRIHLARLVLSVAGIFFVLYLISAELLIIKAVCLWCTSVHVITFAQLILVLSTVPTMLGWGAPPSRPAPAPRRGASSRPRNGSRPAGRDARARPAPSRRR